MAPAQTPSKAMNISLWIAQWLLCIFMLMATVLKFMPIDTIAQKIPWMGQYPPVVVRLLGVIDLAGAIGIAFPMLLNIRPQLTRWAAIGTALIMICAIAFHVSRGEAAVINANIVALLLAVFVAWGRWNTGRA